jgi:hypothetical protein
MEMAMKTNTPTKFTRRQVAALLDISEDEVKSRDNDTLHPTKGKDGSWIYGAEEVAFQMRGGNTAVNAGPPGAICAMAFKLFESGKTLPEVVIALEQVPESVRALRNEYDAMMGSLTISKATVLLIESASRSTVRDEKQLLGLIEGLRGERDAAYQRGYADAGDLGEVYDPRTGKMKPVNPNNVVAEASKESRDSKRAVENEGRVKTSTL